MFRPPEVFTLVIVTECLFLCTSHNHKQSVTLLTRTHVQIRFKNCSIQEFPFSLPPIKKRRLDIHLVFLSATLTPSAMIKRIQSLESLRLICAHCNPKEEMAHPSAAVWEQTLADTAHNEC